MDKKELLGLLDMILVGILILAIYILVQYIIITMIPHRRVVIILSLVALAASSVIAARVLLDMLSKL